MPNDPQIYVAIRPDEYAKLFDIATTDALKRLGTVRFAEGEGKMALPSDVADTTDVLVTSWSTEPFDPALVHGSRLRLAVHTAGTIRGLFPKSVLDSGLRVAQGGAAAMALPVAEMALTLTLALLRNLHTHDRGLQTTRDWVTGGTGMLGRSIQAQHIGIVGLSRTGRHYARMLRGLGVQRISAYDPYVSAEDAQALGVQLVELDELFATSDVVAAHAPVTPQTRGLIGAETLRLLRDGATFINTARSAITDEAALIAELTSGRINAGLDVFDAEPLPSDSPLFGLPNVLLTPHVAGGTIEARFAQGATVVAEIERFLRGDQLQHEVTAEIYDRLS
ncbi:hydroxyacid dehydrogenase [Pseudactinotalea sp. Z1748]|uniref:hydroxyacid dehydrogenase n=1 Tax=Pseudactinotalea sp. Z1748 TaxID=3413027 RepID=UPI003C7D3859